MEPETYAKHEEVLDHGNWNYGLLPGYDEPVTAVITHREYIVPSYIEEHADYRKTIFDRPIRHLWGRHPEDAPPTRPEIPETRYAGQDGEEYEFPVGELVYIADGLHAGFKWNEAGFCRAIRRGEIDVPAPVLIRGFLNDVLVHEDHYDALRETFIEFCQQRPVEGATRSFKL